MSESHRHGSSFVIVAILGECEDERVNQWDVARFGVYGVEVAVVFAGPGFAAKPAAKRRALYEAVRASFPADDGLRANVVLVWQDDAGRMGFLAPPQQHPFWEAMDYAQLRAQVNAQAPVHTVD